MDAIAKLLSGHLPVLEIVWLGIAIIVASGIAVTWSNSRSKIN